MDGSSEPDEIQVLIASFDQVGERVPREALRDLVSLGRQAVPGLMDALRASPHTRVRRWSAAALGEIRDEMTLPALIQALGDPHMSVRLYALRALASFEASKVDWTVLITPLLMDASTGIRVNALAVVAQHEVGGVEAWVVSSLSDSAWQVRLYAIRAVKALGLVAVAAKLEELRSDAQASVRNAALEVLADV